MPEANTQPTQPVQPVQPAQGQQQENQGGWGMAKSLIVRFMVIYFISSIIRSFIMPGSKPAANSTGILFTLIFLKNAYQFILFLILLCFRTTRESDDWPKLVWAESTYWSSLLPSRGIRVRSSKCNFLVEAWKYSLWRLGCWSQRRRVLYLFRPIQAFWGYLYFWLA